MDQNVAPVVQQGTKRVTCKNPVPLEAFVRRRHIGDRQVEPQPPSTTYFLPEVFHPKQDDFLRL